MCASAAAQTPGFALLIRVRRQELEINRCRRDFRRLFRAHSNIISDSLIAPLLEILFTASELLRTPETFHIDETRSILPNLSCREIVDCSHFIGQVQILLPLEL